MSAGAAVAVAITPRPSLADFGRGVPEPIPPIGDAKIKALALRAVEACRAAGAEYADVRLTHSRERRIDPFLSEVRNQETLHVGVRALIGGGWGFASSGLWTPDEMARLGREAVVQAQAIVALGQSPIALAPTTSVVDGHWATPVVIDPFEVSPFEIMDICRARQSDIRKWCQDAGFPVTVYVGEIHCFAQAKVFASSEGSYCSQQLCRTKPSLEMSLGWKYGPGAYDYMMARVVGVVPTGGIGWEALRDLSPEAVVPVAEMLYREKGLPLLDHVDIGRYEAAVSSYTMAQLVHGTLGEATELDRAMGYEADASGTSYLNDPAAMLGTYRVGPELLTVKANRSDPQGCATVRWDDEGVTPADFTLVQDGVLTGFQTTRESAMWLHDVPARRQQPPRSTGCAYAPTAHQAPLTHIPNLTVAPGPDAAADFYDLVREIKDGIAIPHDGEITKDWQGLNGTMRNIYRVKDGKLVGKFRFGKVLFRAPELWKGLQALGGEASLHSAGFSSSKGQPAQESWCTVTAPPALFKQLTLIDGTRR